MAMALKNKPRYDGMRVTREQYLDLEDDGFRYDMIDGVLHMSPSAFFEHNAVILNISGLIFNYLKSGMIARAVSETDVFFPDGGDVVRPDITIILKENYGSIIGHIHGVPDIVAEVLSSSTRDRDLGAKADRYLFNGVKEFWIADPDHKTISIWFNENKKQWAKLDGDSLKSRALPGFILTKNDVF